MGGARGTRKIGMEIWGLLPLNCSLELPMPEKRCERARDASARPLIRNDPCAPPNDNDNDHDNDNDNDGNDTHNDDMNSNSRVINSNSNWNSCNNV